MEACGDIGCMGVVGMGAVSMGAVGAAEGAPGCAIGIDGGVGCGWAGGEPGIAFGATAAIVAGAPMFGFSPGGVMAAGAAEAASFNGLIGSMVSGGPPSAAFAGAAPPSAALPVEPTTSTT